MYRERCTLVQSESLSGGFVAWRRQGGTYEGDGGIGKRAGGDDEHFEACPRRVGVDS